MAILSGFLMNRLHLRPLPGCAAWIYNSSAASLPRELREGEQVAIIDWSSDGGMVVRDSRGRTAIVDRCQIDCGYEFEIAPDDWRFESHPEVLRMLGIRFFELRNRAQAGESLDEPLRQELGVLARVLLRQLGGSD